MFEKASRLKLRFNTPQGALSVEDLWDLPLKSLRLANLDDIAISLDARLKDTSVSFVGDESPANAELRLAFDIVKHVISVRKAEESEKKEAAKKRLQKQSLLKLIAEKEEDSLKEKSVEDLRKMVADL